MVKLIYAFIYCFVFLVQLFASSLDEGVVWRDHLANVTYKGTLFPFNLEEAHLELAAYEFDAFQKLKSIQESPEDGFNLFCSSISVIYLDAKGDMLLKRALLALPAEQSGISTVIPIISISGEHVPEEYLAMRRKNVFLVGLETSPKEILKQSEDKIKTLETLCESLDKVMDRATLSISRTESSKSRFSVMQNEIKEELEQLRESSQLKQSEGEQERFDFLEFTKMRYSPEKTKLLVANVHEGIRRNFSANSRGGDIWHSEQYKIFHRFISEDPLNLVEFYQNLIAPQLKDSFILGCIIHNHSTNDMCCRCAPALAIDYSCEGGTGDLFKQLINQHNNALAERTNTPFSEPIFVNFFVSSRREYHGYDAKVSTPSRRYVNHEDRDDTELLDLWGRRLIVQWPIPIRKIKTLLPPPIIPAAEDALDLAASIFGIDEDS